MNLKTSSFKRLWSFTRSHRHWLFMSTAASIIYSILNLFVAVNIGRSVDTAQAGELEVFIQTAITLAVILILQLPMSALSSYWAGKFGENSLYDLRSKTAAHIQSLPISYLDRHSSADLTTRLNSDVSLIQQLLQGSLPNLISNIITFLVTVAFLFYISFKLSLFSFTIMPILMVVTMFISKPIEKFTKQQQEALADVNAVSKDMIEGMVEAKSFLLEDRLMVKCNTSVDKALDKSLKTVLIQAMISPVNVAMQILPFVLVFAFGGYLVIRGEFSFGELISFINLSNYVVNPLSNLPRQIDDYRTAIAAAGRLFEIWDEKSERTDGSIYDINDIRKADMAVTFENVSFSYDDSKSVLNTLNFEIRPGETIALVGPSGCGKSTVLKIITQFFTPQSGNVKFFGYEAPLWNLDSLRSMISWVSQDTYLYPRSICENIEYGSATATRAEVIEAAKAAGIHDFIESLPDGYDTLVGERGAKLSGGQRQRIAIARAILKDAPILLLDEATSALDTESEHEVQMALERLMEGRTSIVVAHRLSTIKSASKILVMNNGSIVEQGTHDELLDSGDLYKKLYYKQYAVQTETDQLVMEG